MNSFEGHNETGKETIDLSPYDDEYAEAKVQDREFEEIADGKYQVKVDKVELTRAKSSGNPMLKWTLKILGPRHEGRLLWRYNQFATPQNRDWLKTDLHTCGVELGKLSELNDRLEEILDIKLEITKKTKGENSNVFIDRRIEITEGSNDGIGAASEIPF